MTPAPRTPGSAYRQFNNASYLAVHYKGAERDLYPMVETITGEYFYAGMAATNRLGHHYVARVFVATEAEAERLMGCAPWLSHDGSMSLNLVDYREALGDPFAIETIEA